ncbi:MAG: maleate cis-trans isomerase [Candidatus Bathyarchaeia archaeon]
MKDHVRLGLIIPSSNTIVEPEFNRMTPPGFTVHASRMRLRNVDAAELRLMLRDAERCVKELADATVSVVGFACTSGSFVGGPASFKKISAKLERVGGTPSITSSEAVIEALRAVGAASVAVATPYTDSINRREKQMLHHAGFKVSAMKGLGIVGNVKIGRQGPNVAYELGLSVDSKRADAILLSCTNLGTIEIIERLERRLRKPVISSNTATLWLMLKKTGYKKPIHGFGRLFYVGT